MFDIGVTFLRLGYETLTKADCHACDMGKLNRFKDLLVERLLDRFAFADYPATVDEVMYVLERLRRGLIDGTKYYDDADQDCGCLIGTLEAARLGDWCRVHPSATPSCRNQYCQFGRNPLSIEEELFFVVEFGDGPHNSTYCQFLEILLVECIAKIARMQASEITPPVNINPSSHEQLELPS
jgi:hypothetical protein